MSGGTRKASTIARASQHAMPDSDAVWYGMQRYACSAAAAAAAEVVTFPLDVLKVNMQLAGSPNPAVALSSAAPLAPPSPFGAPPAAPAPAASTANQMRSVIREHGARALYRGVVAGVCRQVVYGGFYASAYKPVKQLICGNSSHEPFSKKVLAGGLVSGFGQLVATPFDVAKISMQTDVATAGARQYSGMLHTLRSIHAAHGMRGLFSGWGPAVKRVAFVNGTWIATYDQSKAWVLEHTPLRGVAAYAAASQISGLVAALIGSPIDLIKTRLMSQSGSERYYKNAIDCVRKTVGGEGLRGMYKGFWPSWARSGPWSLIFFVSFEYISMQVFGHSLIS
eukprot:TRINITY_DN171_c3_g2_i1.p1 TRINITY_DN171_c3_g2~~TRINITY_DN171_c3_g2_i1.p1  ORF type:complete len:338 (-),score=87.46 TRINITY_DN171_c3_g2_i1:52-1065(-)